MLPGTVYPFTMLGSTASWVQQILVITGWCRISLLQQHWATPGVTRCLSQHPWRSNSRARGACAHVCPNVFSGWRCGCTWCTWKAAPPCGCARDVTGLRGRPPWSCRSCTWSVKPSAAPGTKPRQALQEQESIQMNFLLSGKPCFNVLQK